MSIKNAILLGLLVPLIGCVVHHSGRHYPRTTHTTVTADASWHDVRWVIWNEYYGCDTATVRYIDTLGIHDDDIFFLLQLSRHLHIPFRDCVGIYRRHHGDLYLVSNHYHVPVG